MVWLPDGGKFLTIQLLVLTKFTNVTDRQTPHDDIGRACIASRGKNCYYKSGNHGHLQPSGVSRGDGATLRQRRGRFRDD